MELSIDQKHELALKNVCLQFMLAYNKRDTDKMLEYCEPGGSVYFEPMGDLGKGQIDMLGKAIWSSLIDCFPDITNEVDRAVVNNENTVRCQVRICGTQARDFAGILNRNKRFNSAHTFSFHLNEHNKIDGIKISWDHADFIRQLGQ
jgi:hypothetical protein